MKKILIVLLLSMFLMSCDFNFDFGSLNPGTNDPENPAEQTKANQLEDMFKVATGQGYTGDLDEWVSEFKNLNTSSSKIKISLVDTNLVWSYVLENKVNILFNIYNLNFSDLTNKVMFRYNGNYIEWKFQDEGIWYQFVEITQAVVKYNVTFADEYGNMLASSQEVEEGKTIQKPINPIREGYNFIGWYYVDTLWEFSTLVYNDILLIAKFEKIEESKKAYSITFKDEYGNMLAEPQEIIEGKTIGKPSDPIREGYDFIGWYYQDILWDFDTLVYSDMVLVAKFKLITSENPSDKITIYYNYEGGYPEKYGYETDKEKVVNNFLLDLYNHLVEQRAFQHKVVDDMLVEDNTLHTPTFEEFSSIDYWSTNYAKYGETILSYYLYTPYCEEDGTINENYRDYIEGSNRFFNTKVGQYWLPLADWVNENTQYINGFGQDFWARSGLPYVSYDLLAKQSYYNESYNRNHSDVLSTCRGTILGSYRFAQYIVGSILDSANLFRNYIPGSAHQQVIHLSTDQLITPEKPAYDFLGWSLEPNSTYYITSISEIAGDVVTLYANWEISDQYKTVEFINDGEVVASYYEVIGTIIEIPNLTKFGYKFMGWSKSPNGDIEEVVNVISENVTYYAVWKELEGFDNTYVDPFYYGSEDNYFQTITEALNNTNPGGTIKVTSGYYEEDIHIQASVTILGPNAGRDATDITRCAEAEINGLVIIDASNVIIDGLKFVGGSTTDGNTPILINGSYDNIQIVNCYLNRLYGVPNPTIANNRRAYINQAKDAVSKDIVVSNNVFDFGSQTGAYIRMSLALNNVENLTYTYNTYKSDLEICPITTAFYLYNASGTVYYYGNTEGLSKTIRGDAVLEENASIKVKFISNGEIISEEIVQSENPISVPSVFREGYDFLGWTLYDNSNKLVDVDYYPIEAVTYYAVWALNYEGLINSNDFTPVYYGDKGSSQPYMSATPTGESLEVQAANVGVGNLAVLVNGKLFILPKYALIELGKNVIGNTTLDESALQVFGAFVWSGQVSNGLNYDYVNDTVTVKSAYGHGAMYYNASEYELTFNVSDCYGRNLYGENYGYNRYAFTYDYQEGKYIAKLVEDYNGTVTLYPGDYLWCPMTAERFCTGLTDCNGTSGVFGAISNGGEVKIIPFNYSQSIDGTIQAFADEMVSLFNNAVISSKVETTQDNFIRTTHPNIKGVFNNLETLVKYQWFLEYILDEMTEQATVNGMLENEYYIETKELLERLIALDVNAINETYPNGRTCLRNFIHHLINAENPNMQESNFAYDPLCVDYKNNPEKLAEFLELYQNKDNIEKIFEITYDKEEVYVGEYITYQEYIYPSLEAYTINWSFSVNGIVELNDQGFKALNPGTVMIIATLAEYNITVEFTVNVLEVIPTKNITINYNYEGGYPAKYGYETDKEKVVNNFLLDLYNHLVEQKAFQHKVVDDMLVEDNTLHTPTFEEFSSIDYWSANYAMYPRTVLDFYLYTPYCEEDGTINENYRDYIEGSNRFFNTKVGQYWLPLADWVNENAQYINGAGQDFWARFGLPYVSYDLLAKQSYVNESHIKDHSSVISTNKGTLIGSYRFAQYIVGSIYDYANLFKNYIPCSVHQQVIHLSTDQLITPEKHGYNFLGWSLEPNSTYYITSISEIAGDVVNLYANWEVSEQYRTVEFINDGEVVVSYYEVIGTIIEIPNLTKFGYKFIGWSTSIDGDVLEDVGIVNENVTYYAIWEELEGLVITYVDPNYQGTEDNYFKTITEALNNTQEGGIIIVTAGTYVEDLSIERSVSIQGPNADIIGNDERVPEADIQGIVTIKASGVEIKGIMLSKTSQIYVNSEIEYITIKNNYITGFWNLNTILFDSQANSKNVLIEGNAFVWQKNSYAFRPIRVSGICENFTFSYNYISNDYSDSTSLIDYLYLQTIKGTLYIMGNDFACVPTTNYTMQVNNLAEATEIKFMNNSINASATGLAQGISFKLLGAETILTISNNTFNNVSGDTIIRTTGEGIVHITDNTFNYPKAGEYELASDPKLRLNVVCAEGSTFIGNYSNASLFIAGGREFTEEGNIFTE